MEENFPQPSNELLLSDEAKAHFYESAKWAKFLGIVGFVVCGLMIIGSFSISRVLSSAELGGLPQGASSMKAMAPFISMVYILVAIVCIVPCIFLFKFGKDMRQSLQTNNQVLFGSAAKNLNRMFKFYAVITIVMLSLYLLAAVVMGIGVAVGAR